MVTQLARMRQRRRTAAQWTSENPVLEPGEIGAVVTGTAIVGIKIGDGATAWNSLPGPMDVIVHPELVAGLGIVLTPAGSWPTATDTVAVDLVDEDLMTSNSAVRPPSQQSVKAYVDGLTPYSDYAINQYYWNFYDGYTGNAYALNTVYYEPHVLRAGTIDRLGIEVTTNLATAIVRVGIYNNDATTHLPSTLIAEGTSGADTYPLDAATTGAKTAAISAVIPLPGTYWFASVNQVAVCSVQHGARGNTVPLPLGTAVPTGASGPKSKTQGSVTGALPGTASVANSFNSHGPRITFRYSV